MFKPTIAYKLALCGMLVAIADFLFYQQPVGWTAGLFAGLVLMMLIGCNRHLFNSLASKILLFGMINLIVSLIESWQLLAVVLIACGMVSLLILQKRQHLPPVVLWFADMLNFGWQGAWQWRRDFIKIKQIGKNRQHQSLNLKFAILPISLTLLFVVLFAQANPIIAHAFDRIDWELVIRLMSVWRWLFWAVTGVVVWALLRPRFLLTRSVETGAVINLERWLNQQTLLLSLLLFNGVFALQNGLDIVFLWSGQALPDGVTYAEYAHSGAYPLLFTSLLTAGYVLITFGEHQQKYQNSLTKKLTFIWLGQNIFLEVSAIDRLLHYIEAYSLTYLRFNALIGIALTAFGLLLIFVKIYTNRHNHWLINANVLALILTLFASCFVNMDKMIADYNVRHALEVTGTGTNIDLVYLDSLGTESLPALRWLQLHNKYGSSRQIRDAEIVKAELEKQLAQEVSNWRSWSWRTQRRQMEINTRPVQAVPIGTAGWHY